MSTDRTEWPLWEVFVRSKSGLDHKHCGSLHASDAAMAIQMARDVYTRRQEGASMKDSEDDRREPVHPALLVDRRDGSSQGLGIS